MGARITQQLAIASLKMALSHRNAAGSLIHPSALGSQYTSQAFKKLLVSQDITPSMSGRGN
jgi:transposase InsO family protein